ncbi:MAG: hypothetical protein ACD_83C00069G0001, partial [uncultured bacterium]
NNITIAAKKGGGDPSANFSLRLAMDRARAANMPKENIERAIKRGTGELAGNKIEELVLEGFGPGKVAIIIEAVTDNKNRTLPEIRTLFTKSGCQLGNAGSVSYQFKQQGVIRISVETNGGSSQLEEKTIESGAEDYKIEDNEMVVLTQIADLQKVKEYFDSQNIVVESAKIEYLPTTTVDLSTSDEDRLMKLMGELDERDDVGEIYTNAR